MNLKTTYNNCSFIENQTDFTLKINNFPEIYFPKNNLYTDFSTNSEWLKSAHIDYNFHEPGMLTALTFIKEKGFKVENIIDIGSLYGYFSKICESIFTEARIFAIEPNYNSYKNLVENSRYTKGHKTRIDCNFMAISDRNSSSFKIFYGYGFMDLTLINLIEYGSKNFIKFLIKRSKSPLLNIFKLKESTLSNFCNTRNFSPDLIKIDVEGYQAKIIPPEYNYILENKPILLLEFDSLIKLTQFKTTNEKIIRPLLQEGYKLYWGDHRKLDDDFLEVGLKDLENQYIDIEKDGLGVLLPPTK